MDTRPRLGTFFILMGLGLLVMFIISVMGKEINVLYLILALAAFFLGFLLNRNRPVNDSGRFGAIRKASTQSRQRREERMSKKKQDKRK
jgi:hypothetical protein